MPTQVDLIPEDAPFPAAQREWLNGLIAVLAGWEGSLGGADQGGGEAKESFPWHDPGMDMDERMELAEGKAHERQLMAAMAQLDCGQCGYLCKTYAEAIAFEGEDLNRCVPGAKETERKLKEVDITKPSDEVIALLADSAGDTEEAEDLRILSERGAEEGQSLLELLRVYPSARPDVQKLADELGPLQPRLYSIASSARKYSNEIHTTVAAVKTAVYGRGYKGVASTFLAKRLSRNGEVPVYIQRSEEFRVHADPDHPAIMIGPGTGIAPFIAFLQEREARGDAGHNWLFFGNLESVKDHIYREQLEAWREGGLISHLTLAFSRDQEDKVYVQNRMREQAREFWAWLEAGAVIYICGDAERMAKDVDAALHRIVQEQGDMGEDAAKRYVETLSAEHRYRRDVY